MARGVLIRVAMTARRSIRNLTGATLAIGGCAFSGQSVVIPAHVLAATLVMNGTTSNATLSFLTHDGAAMHHPADSTCKWDSGNCGWDDPTVATVSGDAPINEALMTTIGGTFLTYTVTVRQPGNAHDAICIFNSPPDTVPCDYGQGSVMLTLQPK